MVPFSTFLLPISFVIKCEFSKSEQFERVYIQIVITKRYTHQRQRKETHGEIIQEEKGKKQRETKHNRRYKTKNKTKHNPPGPPPRFTKGRANGRPSSHPNPGTRDRFIPKPRSIV